MKPTVYIETTIVSYLTAWPSRDLIRAADQQTTREWWEAHSPRFDLVTSQLVVAEASAGDPQAAKDRLAVLRTLRVVDIGYDAQQLARALLAATAVPAAELRDPLHIAVCAANGIDFLLTWNCSHLANAELRHRIEQTCADSGFRPPVITTPRLLSGENNT